MILDTNQRFLNLVNKLNPISSSQIKENIVFLNSDSSSSENVFSEWSKTSFSHSQIKIMNNKQILKLNDLIKGVDIFLAGCINEFLSITSWIRIDTLTRSLDLVSSNGLVLMQIHYNTASSETSLVCSINSHSSSILFTGFNRAN